MSGFIYNKTWLAVTENMFTHSGIEQGTEVHNVLLFKSATDTINQEQSDSASKISFQDDGATLSAFTDLSNMYRKGQRNSINAPGCREKRPEHFPAVV